MIVKFQDSQYLKDNIDLIIPEDFKDKHGLIHILTQNKYPVEKIELLAERLNINYIKNDSTCLGKINDFQYLHDLLSSKLNFNVNHQNKNRDTIFISIFINVVDEVLYVKLLNLLVKNYYDFNILHMNGLTNLDVKCSTSCFKKISYLIAINQCDITKSSIWFYMLINNFNTNALSIIVCTIILKRQDYVSFLNKILPFYSKYQTADKDISLVINLIETCDKNKLIEMIHYTNNEGNNLLHLASLYHLDTIIKTIMVDNSYNHNILLNPNNDNQTPYDLYTKNNIPNLLYKKITLF
jgi:hypothetical protein